MNATMRIPEWIAIGLYMGTLALVVWLANRPERPGR